MYTTDTIQHKDALIFPRFQQASDGGQKAEEKKELLGTVELGENLNISTQFEEEDRTEESSNVS